MAKANRDFEDLFACFNRHEVKALIIGAHALAFHARPRYTKDIDVFVEASPDNARRLMSALEAFGFGGIGLEVSDFGEPGTIVQLGVEPNRVDITTVIDGLTFDEAWPGRVQGTYGDTPVWFLGIEELKKNKAASARTQDLADLEMLERFLGDSALAEEATQEPENS